MTTDHPHPEHDGGLVAQARDKLRAPPRRDMHWVALGAAAFCAVCALVFAAAAVLAPPIRHGPAAKLGVE
jgi:hypothetical protein